MHCSCGKAVLFTIVNDLISFAEYSFLTTEADLRIYAKSELDHATIYSAFIDGMELTNLEIHRVQSQLFSFTMPLDGSSDQFCHSEGISQGYRAFLRPLSVGQHIIHFVREKLKFDDIRHSNFEKENFEAEKFRIEATYYLTVK
jgi:hypothetical protein